MNDKQSSAILDFLIENIFVRFMFDNMSVRWSVVGNQTPVSWLQIVYYLFCTVFLVLGLSWLTSSVVVFFRDLGQIIAMIVQFGFWLTPIFWSMKILPEKYHSIIQYNPVYYIVEGYRDSLIYNTWFWEKTGLTLQFWVIALFFFFAGAVVFRKLRPHFADVL